MNKEFVPYELALRLKAIGFNEPCISFYSKGGNHNYDVQFPCTNIRSWSDQEHYCSAPTFSQTFRWLRDKYLLGHIGVLLSLLDTGKYNYEEAELTCLNKLIEIIENRKSE